MKTKIPFEWEVIAPGAQRAKVIGGWVLNTFNSDSGLNEYTVSEASIFIQDSNHEWEIDNCKHQMTQAAGGEFCILCGMVNRGT